MKKRYKILTAFALTAALLVCLIMTCMYSAKSSVNEYDCTVSAMQFGDIPATTLVASPRDIRGALLLNGNAVTLTTTENDPYDVIVKGLLDESSKISLSGMDVTVDELRSLMTKILNSNPSLFYVEGSYRSGSYDGVTVEYVIPSYKASGNQLSAMRKEYEENVSKILSQVRPSWSSFEKVLFIHDYMVKNFEYDYSNSVYDAYSFLKSKKGVCQAYTLLCIELLSRLDINVGAVPSEEMNHIWNCVELGGKWYHMDVTWGDSSSSENFDRFDEVSYDSFLCGDSTISASGHSGWTSDITFSDDYDNLFLKTVNSKVDVSPLGDDWYILVKGGGSNLGVSVSIANFANNTYTEKAFIKTVWYVWGSTSNYYTDVFAGFGTYHDALVISTSDTLYAYNPSKGVVELGKYTYESGYICGMKINGSKATLRVTKDPGTYSGNSHPEADLSEIAFTLEISYESKTGTDIADTYTASVGWGEDFSVDSPSVSGYTAETARVTGKMSLGGLNKAVAYKAYRTLRIDYVYENGSQAAESYTDTNVEIGSSYSVNAPDVSGYYPSIEKIEGTMTDAGVTVTVTYYESFYDIKINYVYADGSPAGEAYIASGLSYMETYSVTSPAIVGFTPSAPTVSGTITENIELTVTYTVNKYTIEFVSDGEIFFSTEYEHGSEIFLPDEVPQKAPTAEKNYTFKAWVGYTESMTASEDIIFNAEFDESARKYKVTFKNYDGTLLYETEVEYGKAVVYVGEAPMHPSVGNTDYTFVEWDGNTDNIVSDTVFTAVFSDGVTAYTVSFYDENGKLLKTEQVYHGYSSTPPEIPEKESDLVYKYTFNGWIGNYKIVTADSEVKASYKAEYIEYKIVFKDHDGSVISEQKLHYKDAVKLPKEPVRKSDERYDYVFKGWSSEVDLEAVKSAEYIAIFTAHSKFEFSTEDFTEALDEIKSAKTLEERFAAISKALSIKESVYLGDPEVSEGLETLENEIEKYNRDISKINESFLAVSETVLSFGKFDAVYLGAFALLLTVLKKLLGVG